MLQERPCELNKKLKRMQASRDNLKANNREKVIQNKALRDRNKEIIESRDMWRSRSKDLEKALTDQKDNLMREIGTARQAAEEERIRAEEEKKRADLLQNEIEIIKKKVKILRI